MRATCGRCVARPAASGRAPMIGRYWRPFRLSCAPGVAACPLAAAGSPRRRRQRMPYVRAGGSPPYAPGTAAPAASRHAGRSAALRPHPRSRRRASRPRCRRAHTSRRSRPSLPGSSRAPLRQAARPRCHARAAAGPPRALLRSQAARRHLRNRRPRRRRPARPGPRPLNRLPARIAVLHETSHFVPCHLSHDRHEPAHESRAADAPPVPLLPQPVRQPPPQARPPRLRPRPPLRPRAQPRRPVRPGLSRSGPARRQSQECPICPG